MHTEPLDRRRRQRLVGSPLVRRCPRCGNSAVGCKVCNVLDKIPEKQQPRVHQDLRAIVNAPSESAARERIETLAQTLQRDYPKPRHARVKTSIGW